MHRRVIVWDYCSYKNTSAISVLQSNKIEQFISALEHYKYIIITNQTSRCKNNVYCIRLMYLSNNERIVTAVWASFTSAYFAVTKDWTIAPDISVISQLSHNKAEQNSTTMKNPAEASGLILSSTGKKQQLCETAGELWADRRSS